MVTCASRLIILVDIVCLFTYLPAFLNNLYPPSIFISRRWVQKQGDSVSYCCRNQSLSLFNCCFVVCVFIPWLRSSFNEEETPITMLYDYHSNNRCKGRGKWRSRLVPKYDPRVCIEGGGNFHHDSLRQSRDSNLKLTKYY